MSLDITIPIAWGVLLVLLSSAIGYFVGAIATVRHLRRMMTEYERRVHDERERCKS